MPEPQTPPPPTGAPPPANVLAGGAGTPFEQVSEKYRVLKADKTPDLEATLLKVNAGYTELNKRLIDGGAPPEKPEDYKIEGEIGEGVKFEELAKEPTVAKALKSFHAKGMTNAQVKTVFEFFYSDAVADAAESVAACEKALRETGWKVGDTQVSWKSDEDYQKQTKAAYRAAQALAPKIGASADQLFKSYGNDPLIVRMFALLGADMAEDAGVGGDAGGTGTASTIEAIDLRVSEIMGELEKLKSHDPKRKVLLAEKSQLFEKKTKLQAPAS